MGLNMFPSMPMNNKLNIRIADIEYFCKSIKRDSTSSVHIPNSQNIGFFKFREFAVNSTRCTMSISTFSNAISMVICLSTFKKMIWIAARRIVTVMANTFPLWNWSIRVKPCQTMGHSLLKFTDCYRSISKSGTGFPNPRPAFLYVSNLNIFPKLLFKLTSFLCDCKFILHIIQTLCRCFYTARVLLLYPFSLKKQS